MTTTTMLKEKNFTTKRINLQLTYNADAVYSRNVLYKCLSSRAVLHFHFHTTTTTTTATQYNGYTTTTTATTTITTTTTATTTTVTTYLFSHFNERSKNVSTQMNKQANKQASRQASKQQRNCGNNDGKLNCIERINKQRRKFNSTEISCYANKGFVFHTKLTSSTALDSPLLAYPTHPPTIIV
uniref:Uncharacterized protein n=1 Tax=Glossina palpalis gambiensis TaxID=67801 RepID=A0A1B0BAV9_9MUSC